MEGHKSRGAMVEVDASLLMAILGALGLLGGVGLGIKAFYERNLLRAKAGADDANAAAVVVAAARELVDPLRRELSLERQQHELELSAAMERHTMELELERRKALEVRAELQAAMQDVGRLRTELNAALEELSVTRIRLRELEEENAAMRWASRIDLNEEPE
jgi:response regulator RpfG family c-di-GMP phosphodiesterase